MIRKAFVMTLKPEKQEEYQARHNPIWPELHDCLKKDGVQNYSIFLEPGTDRLFAYAEIESEELWQKIAETEACRKWWSNMKDIMFTNVDDSPVALDLREMFHLD
jgi:L-rhamnose mutarotase